MNIRKELNILLVDDDEDEYILLKEIIRRSNPKPGQNKIRLEWASSYGMALKAFEGKIYDAALVDYRLGEHNGLDLLKDLSQRDVKVPVILLTGQGSYDVDVAAMEGGAADYLIKGQVDAPLLERSIRYAIEQKKVQEELEIRVRERTSELEQANRVLKAEIARRQQVEQELRSIQAGLEDRVTERTAALVQANQKLDAIINHIAEAVAVGDADGVLQLANPAAVESLGVDPTGLMWKELADRFSFRYPNDSPISTSLFPAQRAMHGEIVRHESLVFTSAVGHRRQILFSATPMYNDRGHLSGVVTILHDVTEREQLMAQLSVERARLQAVIDNAASGIIVADHEGKVILSNPVAENMLGQDMGQQKMNHLFALEICCTGEDIPISSSPILARAAQEGEVFTDVELSLQLDGREMRYLLANITPIYDQNGKRNGAVGVFQDITSRKQMEEDLHHRAARGHLLARLSGALAEAGLNDRAVLDSVTRQIAEHVGDACIIRLMSENGTRLEPVSFYVNHPDAHEHMSQIFSSFEQGIAEGPSGYVLQSGKALILSEISQEEILQYSPKEYWGWLERYPVCSLLVVPLRIQDRVMGVLMLMRLQAQNFDHPCQFYTQEDLVFFEDLAGRTALAIENARLYEEVQRLSVTDPLTNLYNRRGLMTLSESELRRARRLHQPVGVILLDIDHFKRVNDTYGHPAGDEVLCEVAARLRSSLRNQDILSRYGGEEFAILLPDCSRLMALSIAERLRMVFENHPISTDAGAVSITVSVGVIIDENALQDLSSMVEKADAALYLAKQNGRNRIEVG